MSGDLIQMVEWRDAKGVPRVLVRRLRLGWYISHPESKLGMTLPGETSDDVARVLRDLAHELESPHKIGGEDE